MSRKEFWADQQWGCCGWRSLYFVGGSHARQGQHSCKSWHFSLLKTTCPAVRPPRGLEKLNGFDAIICGEESGMWSCHHSSLSALSALMKAGNNLTAQARGGDWGLWSGAKWGRNEGQRKYLLLSALWEQRLLTRPVHLLHSSKQDVCFGIKANLSLKCFNQKSELSKRFFFR